MPGPEVIVGGRKFDATQLSNPRTAKGAPLRCPECQHYAHAPDTPCKRELAARAA